MDENLPKEQPTVPTIALEFHGKLLVIRLINIPFTEDVLDELASWAPYIRNPNEDDAFGHLEQLLLEIFADDSWFSELDQGIESPAFQKARARVLDMFAKRQAPPELFGGILAGLQDPTKLDELRQALRDAGTGESDSSMPPAAEHGLPELD